MPTSLSWLRSIFSNGVRGILFLRFDFAMATVGFSRNNGSKGSTLPLGLYIGRPFDAVVAAMACSPVESVGCSGAVWLPDCTEDASWILEMSDLGANDRVVACVSGGCVAGCGGFWASFGVSGGCFAGAGGSGWGAGFATVDGFRGGGPVFFFAGLIFFVTILGLRGSFDAWSQPSITVTKPIKQAKLQIRMRFFFMAFQLLFSKGVKYVWGYYFRFFFLRLFVCFCGGGSTNL